MSRGVVAEVAAKVAAKVTAKVAAKVTAKVTAKVATGRSARGSGLLASRRVNAYPLSPILALALGAALVTPTFAAAEEAPEWVIAPGNEARLTRLLQSGGPLPGDLKLDSASIQKDRIEVVYKAAEGDGKLEVVLVHPSKAEPQAMTVGGVALLPRSGAKQEAVDALVARMQAVRQVVAWTKLDPPPKAEAEPDPELRPAALAESALAELEAQAGAGGLTSPAHLLAGADATQACQLSTLSPTLLEAGQSTEAARLMIGVLKLAPDCLGARRELVRAYLAAGMAGDAIQAANGLLAQRPDDWQTLFELAYAYDVQGRLELAVRAYELALRARGELESGDLGTLSSLQMRVRKPRAEQLRYWSELARAKPDDLISHYMTGVLLHYENQFTRSNDWLIPLWGKLGHMPRQYVYTAMNWFNLGEDAKARTLLRKARDFGFSDPDVHYCYAEVFRHLDPAGAKKALEQYLAHSESTAYHKKKEARVRAMIVALQTCIDENLDTCEGPFEHPRNSATAALGTVIPVGAALAILLLGAFGWRRRRS